jgi:DNA polymerase III alpha subunit
MSVRSQVLTPKNWAERAPTYIQEARHFGIHIKTPDINRSAIGFTLIDAENIHFGFNSIRKVGWNVSHMITEARGNQRFTNVMNFLGRVNRQKVNIGVFNNLALAGALDSLGYNRLELVEHSQALYDWFAWQRECEDRRMQNAMRVIENVEIQKLIEQRDEIRKKVKKKDYVVNEEDTLFLEQNKRILLKRELAIPEEPVLPVLTRTKTLALSIPDLMTQGELIGCYLPNPARIAYPNSTIIGAIRDTADYQVAGMVSEIKTFVNSRGTTNYVVITDGTGTIRFPLYSNSKLPVPKKGELVYIEANIGISQTFDEDGENINLKVFKVKKLSVWAAS